MGNQRIERRPPLGGINLGDRNIIAGVRPQSIDCLGRKADEQAVAKRLGGSRNVVMGGHHGSIAVIARSG